MVLGFPKLNYEVDEASSVKENERYEEKREIYCWGGVRR